MLELLPLLVAAAALLSPALALDNGLAQTPPMGLNSYMAHLQPTAGAAELTAIGQFFIDSGMRDLGYVYVNTDEGWELSTRDSNGRLQWDKSKFPMGGPAFIDKLHSMGLKFGIYGAASGVTCGVDPGQLYHEAEDAQTYADWGVDFVKSDNCASYALDPSVRFGALRDALNATGRPIFLSIEPFSMEPSEEVSVKISNMARIGCDIRGNIDTVLARADLTDKWSPLAGPGYFNDPDMINVQNPPSGDGGGGLTLGENRIYFGMWAIAKAPLLLSANLSALSADVLAIVKNKGVIAVNQDPLGVQARKLVIDGRPVPWLVGLRDCAGPPAENHRRNLPTPGAAGSFDVRVWKVNAVSQGNGSAAARVYQIQNTATGRCLAAVSGAEVSQYPPTNLTVALLPCNASAASQQWRFDMGVTTVTAVTNQACGLALAITNSTLYAKIQQVKDAFAVSDLAYGTSALSLVPPYDQPNCTSRDCQNYDPSQMWYFSPTEGFLRHSLYTASMNHAIVGTGYELTAKVPTTRHNCLAHTLSIGNTGTVAANTTEVWGGPLSGGRYVMALLNRGSSGTVTITADFAALEVPGVSSTSVFQVTELWSGTALGKKTGSFSYPVPQLDVAIFVLEP